MATLVRALNNDFIDFSGFFARVNEMFVTWKARAEYRRELADLSIHDMQDIGIDQTDVIHESAKPFWIA